MLIAEILYLTASFFIPQIPGWKMFASFERLDFKLVDGNGNTIDHRPMLPTVVYQFSQYRILNFSKFACLKRDDRKVILIISEKEKYLFQGPSCDYQKI